MREREGEEWTVWKRETMRREKESTCGGGLENDKGSYKLYHHKRMPILLTKYIYIYKEIGTAL